MIEKPDQIDMMIKASFDSHSEEAKQIVQEQVCNHCPFVRKECLTSPCQVAIFQVLLCESQITAKGAQWN